MSNFSNLKQSSQESLRKLTEQINKMNPESDTKKSGDENFWKPTVDKAGNGSAIIRFLPAPDGEDVPFIRYWDHGFQGPSGKWYIEKSLTTIGEKDPVSEYNSKLWKESDNDDSPQRKQARKQKRRLHYIANIYVVKDPGNPENNGKVFLYDFGKKIFEKINAVMHPVEDGIEDATPINPFDMWTGANFYLRMRQVDGYRSYETSSFGESKPLLNDDKALEEIWKQEYPLKSFLDPSKFKSFADLDRRLREVLELSVQPASEDEQSKIAEPPSMKVAAAKTSPKKNSTEDDEDEEDLSFFRKLAEEE
jgi:hypothetical protein